MQKNNCIKIMIVAIIATTLLLSIAIVNATGNIQHETEYISPGWGFDEAKGLEKLSSNNGELIVLQNDTALIKFVSSNKNPWVLVAEGDVEGIAFDFYVQYGGTDVYKKSVLMVGPGIDEIIPGITGTGKSSINEIRVCTIATSNNPIVDEQIFTQRTRGDDSIAIDDKETIAIDEGEQIVFNSYSSIAINEDKIVTIDNEDYSIATPDEYGIPCECCTNYGASSTFTTKNKIVNNSYEHSYENTSSIATHNKIAMKETGAGELLFVICILFICCFAGLKSDKYRKA